MISEDMLKIGLAKGVVRLIDSPNDGEPACQIGEHWFYYAGSKGTGMSTEAYVRETLFEDIIHEILDALVSILADVNKDEYLYYEAVLRENGCEPVPRAYVVRVSESNSIQVIVRAKSAAAAEDIALKLADSGAIDLERNCFDGYEAITQRVAKAEELSEFDQYSEEDLK